jgi:ABC-type nitrate/sulfonate/bicarbonate transport system permease component
MVLGANRFQVFYRVTLPLSIPGVVAGSLLVFFVGGRVVRDATTHWKKSDQVVPQPWRRAGVDRL